MSNTKLWVATIVGRLGEQDKVLLPVAGMQQALDRACEVEKTALAVGRSTVRSYVSNRLDVPLKNGRHVRLRPAAGAAPGLDAVLNSIPDVPDDTEIQVTLTARELRYLRERMTSAP